MLRTTLITTALLMATPAYGQGVPTSKSPAPSAPAAPQATVDKEVKRLYAEGSKAADLKQWEKARGLFEEAFKLDPRPKIAAASVTATYAPGFPRRCE